MSTTATAVTPDDLLRMGDEGKGYELVDGELRELPVSRKSSRVAGQIYNRLENFCAGGRPAWVFPEGTSYRCFADDPGRVRRPDVSVVLLGRMTAEEYDEDGHCPTAPDLVVEVVSPTDIAREVKEKIDEWLAAGVRLLWEVYPESRTVRVYRPAHPITPLQAGDALTADPVLPGFSCPVADLFRLPGEPPVVQ